MDLQNPNEAHTSTINGIEEDSEAVPASPRHNSVSTVSSIQTHPRSQNGRNEDTFNQLQYRPHASNEPHPFFPPTTLKPSYSLSLLQRSTLMCFTDWHLQNCPTVAVEGSGEVLTRHTPGISKAPPLLWLLLLVPP